MTKLKFSFLLAFLLFIIPTSANASNIYYVSTTGSDSGSGSNLNPWKTIQKAANTAIAGDVINVLNGNYSAERVNINNSGSPGKPISYIAQANVLTKGFSIKANYITINGFEITDTDNSDRDGWGIYLTGSNCVLENNYIHYTTRGGIYLYADSSNPSQTTNCIVRNNKLYKNSQEGIEVNGINHLIEKNEIWGTIQHHPKWINAPTWIDADGIRFFGSGHVFRENYIHDILAYSPPENINPHVDAFQTWDEDVLKAGSNILFENNKIMLIDNNIKSGTTGFQIAGGAKNITIRNNIVQAFAGVRAYKRTASPYTSPSNLDIQNNIFYGSLIFTNWPVGVTIADTLGVVIKNNIFYNQADYVIDIANSSDVNVDYNIAFNDNNLTPKNPIGITMQHNLWGFNPQFLNTTNEEFYLQPNSPACTNGENGTYIGAIACNPQITRNPSDINNDGLINIIDIGIIIDNYGSASPTNPFADINNDGLINIIDIGIIIDNYEK